MSASGEPLLEVTDLVKHFPIKRGILIDREVDQVRAVDGISFSDPPRRDPRPRRRVGQRQVDRVSRRAAADQADLGLGPVRGPGDRRALAPADAAAAARDADDLPGPLRLAQPAQTDRADRRRPAASARASPPAPTCAGGSRSCWSASVSRPSTTTASRTSSPAASGSGSGSRGRWRCSRSWSSPTSRSPPSTSRSRPRSSTYSTTSRTSSASPTSSSPTTSASSATSLTGSR